MPTPPPGSRIQTPVVLDYAPRLRRGGAAAVIWLMPLWCGLIIAAAWWPGAHGDDPLWLAAMGLPFVAFVGCALRRRWTLAWYCLAVSAIVAAVGVLLPVVNHAT
jgi:hypothetical protein